MAAIVIFADDVIGFSLIAEIDDTAFFLVRAYGSGSLRTVKAIGCDGRAVEQVEGRLNLGDVVARSTLNDMRSVIHGGSFELGIAAKQPREKSHKGNSFRVPPFASW